MLAEEEAQTRTAFDALYTLEFTAIARLAFLIVRSPEVAEELAQESFVRLYQHHAEVTNPAGFLRTVVVRLASTWRSRHQMEAQRLALMEAPVTDDGFEIDETWSALGRLRPERGTVLVLRYYADLSYLDIARALGCSAATARSRTRRALSDLRKELSQ
jgi:RNA polymerase sigma factor (sigma-70 family)